MKITTVTVQIILALVHRLLELGKSDRRILLDFQTRLLFKSTKRYIPFRLPVYLHGRLLEIANIYTLLA